MNLLAPFAGTVVSVPHAIDDTVSAGTPVVVLEALKMEHELVADTAATVERLEVTVGDTVTEGQLLAVLGEARGTPLQPPAPALAERDALDEVMQRHAVGLDAARPEAVAARRARGHRTARENLAELLDEGSFVEYGPLMFAAQERRRSREELIARTPADGLVGGVGTIDGAPCVAMSYDYTVLAGTQGMRNHQKKDRLFERLSGLVPLVGIASGYCFAGNAALLGCCDVVIATEDASIGMGGPAMIEGGGLGVVAPRDVGPIDTQDANGVVDLRVDDDAAAVR